MAEQTAASFQQLPKRILDKIIYLWYEPLNHPAMQRYICKYEELCRLSWTCRGLRQTIKPLLRQRLIFEQYDMRLGQRDSAFITFEEIGEAKKQPAQPKWFTNMPMLVLSGEMERVSEVLISSHEMTPEPLSVLTQLQEHKVDRYEWPNATRLLLNFPSDGILDSHSRPAAEGEWFSDEHLAMMSRFLVKKFPNVNTVHMRDSNCKQLGLRNTLSSYISEQLSKLTCLHLHFHHLPVFGVKMLPAQITHLELVQSASGSSGGDIMELPRMVAPTLVSLTLDAVVISQLWDRFCGLPGTPASRVVEFSRLESLELRFYMPFLRIPTRKDDEYLWDNSLPGDYYDSDAVESSVGSARNLSTKLTLRTIPVRDRSPKYTTIRAGSKQPRFPQLRVLRLRQYPGRLSEFLSYIAADKLQTLDVTGDLVVFKGLRLDKLTSMTSCSLSSHSPHARREWAHARRLVLKPFKQGRNLRHLSVGVAAETPMSIPPAMINVQSTGIRELELTLRIAIPDLIPLLCKLPQLESLSLMRLYLLHLPSHAGTAEGMAQALLASGISTPLDSKILHVKFEMFHTDKCERTVLYNVMLLITRTVSLRKLRMTGYFIHKFYRELLPLLKIPQLFPHIRHLASLELSDGFS
ncbi:hypothetical protein IWW36_001422 [Coemansia brasiliensis]|uniref:Uncharacterized protein n=1 Tax=Coemansia brasiliensis TaxID=2650707 RepID=A0A9W8M0E6_9FUNG|nr:hypothetical protein IWW36_001422 [Coemansia brasiliensis]